MNDGREGFVQLFLALGLPPFFSHSAHARQGPGAGDVFSHIINKNDEEYRHDFYLTSSYQFTIQTKERKRKDVEAREKGNRKYAKRVWRSASCMQIKFTSNPNAHN